MAAEYQLPVALLLEYCVVGGAPEYYFGYVRLSDMQVQSQTKNAGKDNEK